MLVDGDDHPRRIEPELLRGRVEDPLIGLVRDDPVDFVRRVAGRLERLAEDGGKVGHRVAEHLLALHSELADRPGGRGAAVDIEQLIVAAVGMELGREDSAILGLLDSEQDRSGAVAEQDAGRPVFPVEDPAERLRSDHQSMIGHAALDHIVGDRQRVEEAGADGRNVEGDAVVDPERGLDESRAGREGLVGSRGGENDQSDLLRLDARRGESLLGRLGREGRGGFAGAAIWRASIPVRSTIHSWVVSTRSAS